jgi:hypothetical protein
MPGFTCMAPPSIVPSLATVQAGSRAGNPFLRSDAYESPISYERMQLLSPKRESVHLSTEPG